MATALHLASLALAVTMTGATYGSISDAFFSRSLQGVKLHGAWQAQQPSPTSANASEFVHIVEQLSRQAHPSVINVSRSLAGSVLFDTASILEREVGSWAASSGFSSHSPTAVLVVCGGVADCDLARVLRLWLGGTARVWAVVGDVNSVSDLESSWHRDTIHGDVGQAAFWRRSVFDGLSQDMATVVIDRGSGLSESQVLISLRECLPRVIAGGSVISVGGSQHSGVGIEAALVHRSMRVRELEARCGGQISTASASLSWSALGRGLGSMLRHGEAWMAWAGAKYSEIDPELMSQSGMSRIEDVQTVMGQSSSLQTVTWGLDEELDSLVADIHGWWGYSEVTATRPTDIVNAPGGSNICLLGSRLVRQSVLGERWRSWFMRSTESISWGPSWTLIRRVHRVGSRSFPHDNVGGLIVQSVAGVVATEEGYRGYMGAMPTQDWLDTMVAAGAIPPRTASPPRTH